MRILMISIGQDILREGSVTQMRHFEYGKICESLDIIVLHSASGRDAINRVSTEGWICENNNVRIFGTGGSNKISTFFRACALAGKIMREKKIDLITTQDAGYAGLIGCCLKKKFKVKLNIQIHGQEEKLLNKILFFSLKSKIIKSADSVRVVSERLKKWVVDKYGVDEKKIFVIPIYTKYTNIRMYANDTNVTNKKKQTDFTILTVGRLVKVKNIKLQIEALADVVKIFPDVKLIIVGDGTEKENLQKLASKLKLDDSVEFAGWQKDLAPYYENADLFLLTSNNEGWGMSVIEAMTAGCPVTMTDVGCAGEIVKNEENGIVIHTGDKKALIAAICKMIADKRKREMFSKKGKETILTLPSKEETLAMYKKMWGD